MSTLTERVDAIMSNARFSTSGNRRAARTLVIMAMREQEKITRHACAENVAKTWLDHRERKRINTDDLYSDIHAAIMNTTTT
jgi:hypothetical protein